MSGVRQPRDGARHFDRRWKARRVRTGLLALGVCAALASGAAVRAARRQAQDAPGSSQATSVEPRSEHVGGGVFNVFFDIASLDPAAVFTVWLEVSLDGGRTFDFRPQSVSGDIGPNVRPGKGKRIVWN